MQELKKIDLNKHPVPHLKIKRKIRVERAKSPSDMIWKNVGYPKWKLFTWFFWAGLFVLVIGFMALLLFAAEISIQMYIGYRGNPPGINCEKILLPEKNDYAAQTYLAAIEYLKIQMEKTYNPGLQNLTYRIPKIGVLPCFCAQEHA